MRDKAYVIDYEIVSPLGIGKEKFAKSILEDKSSIDFIKNFYSQGLETNIAAEIRENLSEFYLNEPEQLKEKIKKDRRLELIVTAFNIIKDRIQPYAKNITPERAGVIMGVGAETGLFNFLDFLIPLLNKNQDFDIKQYNNFFQPYDIFSIYIAEKLKLARFQQSVMTACAASNQAIGLAADYIKNNLADFVVAGGTDSIINTISFIAFEKLGTLASPANPVQQSCKPFDVIRNGTIAGEAAGLVILASEEFITKNNIKPLFEIVGFGQSLDAYMITAPSPDGSGMKKAMLKAMHDANLTTKDIQHINAHGTGTRLNDEAEATAIYEVFGENLENIIINSTKDRHGHAIAAAGIQEFAVVATSLTHNYIPHILNLKNPIEIPFFNPLKDQGINKKIKFAMTTNYGFGGVNSALIIKNLL
jgi:3-oxoacyl-[acyl-carrier-protein] synthase II